MFKFIIATIKIIWTMSRCKTGCEFNKNDFTACSHHEDKVNRYVNGGVKYYPMPY